MNPVSSGVLHDISYSLRNLKEGSAAAIKTIGDLSKIIIDAVDWIATILLNPSIVLSFVDQMTIVIITVLIILKMLGFKDLEKWILLSILAKVIAIVLL